MSRYVCSVRKSAYSDVRNVFRPRGGSVSDIYTRVFSSDVHFLPFLFRPSVNPFLTHFPALNLFRPGPEGKLTASFQRLLSPSHL